MLSAFVLSAVVGLAPLVAAGPNPRVRPMSEAARQLVEEATKRSPTIARLIEFIERSDAIVYIDLEFDLRSEGATTLIAANDLCRFLRISIGKTLTTYRRIELLGHELHHTVEIIQSPQVRDGAGLRSLFSKIGWLLTDLSFESAGAISAERQVRNELRSSALRR